ncbi:MAG TPA: hypothetical protein VGJ66_12015 [Pyrinomonadaceae bacterium]|jgi:hypothetical protein
MGIQEKRISPSLPTNKSQSIGAKERIGIGRLRKLIVLAIAVAAALLIIASPAGSLVVALLSFDKQIDDNVVQMVSQGRQTFRFDTFGDEAFWGDMLKLHQAIEGTQFGGVGPGLSPSAALALGLKVDVDALPAGVVKQLKQGKLDLNDPAVTLVLLRHNAVLGVEGFFNEDNGLRSVGITCALCHSTVDNSLTTGVGQRLDGWANRDLNVGEIVALAPDLSPFANLLGVDQGTVRTVLRSWGPGKFDAELILDGKAFNPQQISNGVVTGTNVPAATLIPPAFGLAGVNLHTWTGWGSVTHWNAFVSNLEMHGRGTFFDPRLNDAAKFPIAAANGFGNVRNAPDLITSKLAALHFYQLGIPAPRPLDGSFDVVAATTGQTVFNVKGQCAACHVPPLFSEPGWNMHPPAQICVDDFQAKRSPDEHYRTSPLRGLWTHQRGGFFHDGRFATLLDVVNHYNTCFGLGLTAAEKSDLVEYLKSL